MSRRADARPFDRSLAPGVRLDRVEPLGVRVDRNRWKFLGFITVFILAVSGFFTLLVTGTVWLFTLIVAVEARAWRVLAELDAFALVVAAVTPVFTAAWVVLELGSAEHILVHRLGARAVPPDSLRPTKRVLHDMMLAAGLKKQPRLYILDLPDKVNAFVIGRSPDSAVFGVTRGFVEKLTPDEQRAVFSNLMARARSLDILWATAVSLLMGPVWRFREYGIGGQGSDLAMDAPRSGWVADMMNAWLSLYVIVIVITELLSYGHQQTAWMTGEVADAEGMLLLKDPRSAVRALERVLSHDNHVPSAGDAYSQLFYCWAGFGFAPEQDPEMRRVARLREVLGVDALIAEPAPNAPGWPVAPPPPRFERAEGGATVE